MSPLSITKNRATALQLVISIFTDLFIDLTLLRGLFQSSGHWHLWKIVYTGAWEANRPPNACLGYFLQ